MDFDRRLLVGGLAAAAGLGPAAVLGAERDGHRPATYKDMDALARTMTMPAPLVCVRATPMTEGPYYYETSLERRSIAEKRPGVTLRLGITLGGLSSREGQCFPLAGAAVDIWHADAAGLYSNVGTDLQPVNTIGQTFLRGHQFTDQNGYVEFDTILPGWEIVASAADVPGVPPIVATPRTTHIHVKAFHGREVMTTQLFFEDSLLDQVFAEIEPYRSNQTLTFPRLQPYSRIRNTQDRFFNEAKAQPIRADRVDGVLVAKAMIGVMSQGNQGFQTLWR